jgi:D-ribose pyranose/furanose isomerase RbsD
MTLKEWLVKIIDRLGGLEELIANMPVPAEVQLIDTKIEALTGELKAKLGL